MSSDNNLGGSINDEIVIKNEDIFNLLLRMMSINFIGIEFVILWYKLILHNIKLIINLIGN